MKNLIFGSTALKHWFPNYDKEPKDLDVISKNQGREHYWVEGFQYIIDNNKDDLYVDPDFLYTIKVSHAAWDIRWDKTMHHIAFLKEQGCTLDLTLYSLLWKDWEKEHRHKKMKFNVKNEDFFTANVTRKYNHDWLHEYFAFYEKPLFTKIQKNPDSPLCSKQLWDKLSYDDKIKCALEEIYVVSTERYFLKGYPPKHAKLAGMKALITSLTKGWFNLFLIENFNKLYYYNDEQWLNKLKELK